MNIKLSDFLYNDDIVKTNLEKSNDWIANIAYKVFSQDGELEIAFDDRYLKSLVMVGDKMKVKNLNGSKKINDILIDLKISKEKRNTWPLLVDSNNEILLIPGLKKSKFDTQNNNECDIIITCVKKERHYA